jgi:galactokinase
MASRASIETLLDQFAAAFPHSAHRDVCVFRAPGRVNLIGEHTDYNEGFVMPGAIAFEHRVAVASNDSRELTIHSLQEQKTVTFSIDDPDPKPRRDWTDYVRGVQIQLRRSGRRIPGADLLIDGHVPMGAGLSSSAALEVASALAMLHTCGQTMAPADLAKICQRAENEFVGARCGIMDQFSSINGRAGHAVMLDCRSLQATYVPLPASVAVVICNTMVRHSIAAGEYNQRRNECERCVEYFRSNRQGIASLRDVTERDLREYGSGLPEALLRRAKHVITENGRVLAAARAFEIDDLRSVGKLMYQSHASLRDDYEVSCPELNVMVDLASAISGTYGSRMTGGGFGGCTVSLVERNVVDRFTAEVKSGYERATGIRPDIFVTTLVDGAGPLDLAELKQT